MTDRIGRLAAALGIFGVLLGTVVFAYLSDRAPDLTQIYDPVRSGEPLPPGFRQILNRDAILPIYRPEFVTAAQTPWKDDTLVIGIEADGEAKAYPVSHLNGREMVIDSIAGIPVLVTW